MSQEITKIKIKGKKPLLLPKNKNFGVGPVRKHKNWKPQYFNSELLGRSHFSKEWLAFNNNLLLRTKKILKIPNDYKIALIPGSATGAHEAVFWNMLGPKEIEVAANGIFGNLWLRDAAKIMPANTVHRLDVLENNIYDLNRCDPEKDLIFVFNASATGLSYENHPAFSKTNDKFHKNNGALTFCDATSAAFCMDLPWHCLDATMFSWQKGIGGEAGIGMAVFSPKAYDRLRNYESERPIPKTINFRHQITGKLLDDLFEGRTMTTPSLLSLLDYNHCLDIYQDYGGIEQVINHCQSNKELVLQWLQKNSDMVGLLTSNPNCASSTTFCFGINEALYAKYNILSMRQKWQVIKDITTMLEDVAHDTKGHIMANPCFRIWIGWTMDKNDLKIILDWIIWAIEETFISIDLNHNKRS